MIDQNEETQSYKFNYMTELGVGLPLWRALACGSFIQQPAIHRKKFFPFLKTRPQGCISHMDTRSIGTNTEPGKLFENKQEFYSALHVPVLFKEKSSFHSDKGFSMEKLIEHSNEFITKKVETRSIGIQTDGNNDRDWVVINQ